MGSVIQATGTVEFEEEFGDKESTKGSKWSAEGLQRVCTILVVLSGAVCTPRFLREQTEFHYAEVCVAD